MFNKSNTLRFYWIVPPGKVKIAGGRQKYTCGGLFEFHHSNPMASLFRQTIPKPFDLGMSL